MITDSLKREIDDANYDEAVTILLRLLDERKGYEEDWIDEVDYAAQRIRDLSA